MDSSTMVILGGQALSLVVVVVTMHNNIANLKTEVSKQEKKIDRLQTTVNDYEPRIKVLEVTRQ